MREQHWLYCPNARPHQPTFWLICWLIKPLDNRKIQIREFNGLVVSEKVFWNSKVRHPDFFLLPIRPPEDGQAFDTNTELKIERTNHANV
jgi:hypothetical protein